MMRLNCFQQLVVLLSIGTIICAQTSLDPVVDEDDERLYEEQDLGARFDPVTGQRRYDGYQLLKVNATTPEHLEVLRFLERGLVQLWSAIPANVTSSHDINMMVAPEHLNHVKNYLSCSDIPTSVVLENIQQEIDDEQVPVDNEDDEKLLIGRPGFCTNRVGFNWKKYHRVETMNLYIDCLAVEHQDKVTLMDIGRSSEGRPLRVLKIGRQQNGVTKPSIWIDGGIHAREWVSPAAVLYMVSQFVENYGDPANKNLVDHFDIYVLPLANPDGYEYSHKRDRMWRKTRSKTGSRACKGVDPNRNWGYKWGGAGASANPCSETYRGPHAFSEPETIAIRDFILANKQRQPLKMYLTFHSYGQYILYPWGYDRLDTKDTRDLHSMAKEARNAIINAGGDGYSIGSAAKLLYPAAGGSDDWAKGGAGIKYSYTVELPDTGRHGFLLPTSRIKKASIEAHEAVKAMLNKLWREE